MLQFVVKFLSVLLIGFPTVASAQKSLKVATYNIGMLPTVSLGFMKVSGVPLLEERQSTLADGLRGILDSEDIDVLTIQEAWTSQSVETLRSLHPDYDYLHVEGEAVMDLLEQATGLGILIKKSLKAKSSFERFEGAESIICGGGAACNRGLQIAEFNFEGQPWFIFNSHFTPVIRMTEFRRKQIDKMNEIRLARLKENPDAIVVAAGDFNVSPDFGELKAGDDGDQAAWQKNADLFPLLMETGGLGTCHDSYLSMPEGERNFIFTQNRDTNTLTAQSSSTNIEPNQRIDHIIACTSQDIEFKNTQRILEEPFQINEELSTELSDHYGIITEILF